MPGTPSSFPHPDNNPTNPKENPPDPGGFCISPPKRYIPGGISVNDLEAARVNSRKSIEEEHVG